MVWGSGFGVQCWVLEFTGGCGLELRKVIGGELGAGLREVPVGREGAIEV
jgi:hypothetical protein